MSGNRDQLILEELSRSAQARGSVGHVVLGLDPGTSQSGWLIWDYDTPRVLAMGKTDNQMLRAELPELLRRHRVTVVGIEEIRSYGMAVGAEVFDTCVWIGRFVERILPSQCRIYRLRRKDHVCMNICNSSRAKDSNIRAALIDRFGEPGVKKSPGVLYKVSKDMWSALALAVTLGDLLKRGDPPTRF